MIEDETPLGLFGAFERHNFGDWLMAYCATELIKPKQTEWLYDFDDFGLGINPCVGNYVKLNDFLNRTPEPNIIHVGGETLACTSKYAAEKSSQTNKLTFNRPLHYVLPEKLESKVIRRFFFGVGGMGIPVLDRTQTESLVDSLESALWVSVRDPLSQTNLRNIGVRARLGPDLVHVISKLLPREAQSSNEKTKLVLQISEILLKTYLNETSDLIIKYFSEYDSITLVIAGIAPGHDSFCAYFNLVGIVNKTRTNWVKILFDIDPLSIVREIASADLVVASSLHFRIVAMSYAVPRISIFVEKSINYGNYWDIEDFSLEDYSKISEVISRIANLELEQLEVVSLLRTKEVLENWDEMMEAYGQ
jgi:Polysaccharide pyruvyl transferase